MMGSKGPFMSSSDDMESLILEDSTLKDFRSAMSGSSSSIATPPPISDPLSGIGSHGGDFRIDYDADLPPPSYQDVVGEGSSGSGYGGAGSHPQRSDGYGFSSHQSSSAVASGGGGGRRGSGGKDYLDIRVLEPQKVQDPGSSIVPGGGGYVTYNVVTDTNMADYAAQQLTTRRRFRDFVALADRLATQYRGYFIPPRPDKGVVEGQVMAGKEFVELRRVALERYLRRLAAHPVIRKSNELRIFLETEGHLPFPPATAMASRIFGSADGGASLAESVRGGVGDGAKSGGRDFFRMFKEMRQSVANEWTRGSPGVGGEEIREFLEKKEKVGEIEKHLAEASSQAISLVSAKEELGKAMAQVGMSFQKLAMFEEASCRQGVGVGRVGAGGGASSEVQRQQGYDDKRIGNAALEASRVEGQCTLKTKARLVTLTDYLEMMLALHAAFADRQQAMVSLQTVGGELVGKKERLAKMEEAAKKVLGGDKARVVKTKEEIQKMEYARGEEEKEYEKLKERNWSELLRFDEERQHDLFSMIHGFVRSEIECAEALESSWSKAAKGFEDVKVIRAKAGGGLGETSSAHEFE